MREKLIKLLYRSYAPYSQFHVAAIAEMTDGKCVPGVNVENSSYGATICAERNAIMSAVALGYKKDEFKKLYVMVSGEKISKPCFVCRQVIAEFFKPDSEIVLMGKGDEIEVYKVSELCPYPFDESDL